MPFLTFQELDLLCKVPKHILKFSTSYCGMCVYVCVFKGFVMELQRIKIPCVKNITVDPFKALILLL